MSIDFKIGIVDFQVRKVCFSIIKEREKNVLDSSWLFKV